MTLTIKLEQEVGDRLQSAAAREGLAVTDYAKGVLASQVLPLSLRVAALPPEEQERIMADAAETMAFLYEADLALPPAERELTAFTALDGEDFEDRIYAVFTSRANFSAAVYKEEAFFLTC